MARSSALAPPNERERSAQRSAVLPLIAPGVLIAAVIGLAATGIGSVIPVVGAPVIAVVIGVALSPVVATIDRRRATPLVAPGLRVAKGFILQLSVVLLGAQLSLAEVAQVGVSSLPVMLGTLAVCLALAYVVGRALGIDADLRTLIGVGTGICGASAIAAVSPTIRARSVDIAYAISTIFVFDVAAVLLFPPLGHALGLSQEAFGLFAGTAVNDTSSVVAAASSYGSAAADHAVVVKLVRTLMIIPIVIALGVIVQRREARNSIAGAEVVTPARGVGGQVWSIVRLVPWFLIGFLIVVAAHSLGLVPTSAQPSLRETAGILIAIALAAIGLSTDLPALRRSGFRPLLLGLLLWIAVAATSLLLQLATGGV